MEHSKNYSKVKLWYRMKMWNETKVRNAVKMGSPKRSSLRSPVKITNERSVRRQERVKIRSDYVLDRVA